MSAFRLFSNSARFLTSPPNLSARGRFTLLLFLCFTIPICSPAQETTPADSTDSPRGKWTILAVPYITASSDFGLEGGIGLGAAQGKDRFLEATVVFGADGNFGGAVRGELRFGHWRFVREISAYRYKRFTYSPTGSPPETTATATVDQVNILLTAYTPVYKNIESGPDFQFSYANGGQSFDTNGIPLAVGDSPRFQRGSVLLAGVRTRWRTTSAVRPIDGLIAETAIRWGRAEGCELTHPRFDMATELKIACSRPISRRLRLYVRGSGVFQYAAPTPVRNYLGGEKTLRGQPDRREFGRRLLLGRVQAHWTAFEKMLWPARLAHSLLPVIVARPVIVETVAFLDFGAIGDPEFPWRRTRKGYGLGLRLVLPPELVFRFDFAWTPDNNRAFYFGAGETL